MHPCLSSDCRLTCPAGRESVEKLIEGGAAPVDLTPAQLLAVMDGLFTAEAQWHQGAIIAQTVLASLYMLRLDRCVLWV